MAPASIASQLCIYISCTVAQWFEMAVVVEVFSSSFEEVFQTRCTTSGEELPFESVEHVLYEGVVSFSVVCIMLVPHYQQF